MNFIRFLLTKLDHASWAAINADRYMWEMVTGLRGVVVRPPVMPAGTIDPDDEAWLMDLVNLYLRVDIISRFHHPSGFNNRDRGTTILQDASDLNVFINEECFEPPFWYLRDDEYSDDAEFLLRVGDMPTRVIFEGFQPPADLDGYEEDFEEED